MRNKITIVGAGMVGASCAAWLAERELGDIVLGFDNLDAYLAGHPYFGATVGRVANRIGGAKFTLDGKEYLLAPNDGPNTLHGGIVGFDKVVWKATPLRTAAGPAVRFEYLSRDGEEGFPGNLRVRVTYTLTNDNALRIDYSFGRSRKWPEPEAAITAPAAEANWVRPAAPDFASSTSPRK